MRWHGIIRGEHGDIPLQITVSDSGALHAMVGQSPRVALQPARQTGILLRFNLPGTFASADSSMGQLPFYNGCVTAHYGETSRRIHRCPSSRDE
jgi:hypothetical protein